MSNDDFSSFGSLANFFPDQQIHCMNHTCKNTWTHLRKKNDSSAPVKQFCESCQEKLSTLEDIVLQCSHEGCEKTWKWTAKEQLYSKNGNPPQGFCSECAKKAKAPQRNLEIPCRIKECSNTWIWSARDQERAKEENKSMPRRLCSQCESELKKLSEIKVSCKVVGCKEEFGYAPIAQLIDQKSGKKEDFKPIRMCNKCLEKLAKLKPISVPCKIRECKETWEISPYMQLEHFNKFGEDAKMPERMCNNCYKLINSLEEKKFRCKNKGCKNDWVYTKSQQMSDSLRKIRPHLRRNCEECAKKIKELTPLELSCKYEKEGCKNTWTYSVDDQLAANLLGKSVPNRACPSCSEFLAKTAEKKYECKKCKKEISNSSFIQLFQKLGYFHENEICSDCLQEQLKNDVQNIDGDPEKVIIHHTHVVKLPTKGTWLNDATIRNLPPFIGNSTIEKVLDADVVIAVIGDNEIFTENEEVTQMIEENLSRRHTNFKIVVINSSIANTDAEQAAMRFGRDVLPFEPNLVIFSFDSFYSQIKETHSKSNYVSVHDNAKMEKDLQRLLQEISKKKLNCAYFTSSPIIVSHNPPEILKRNELDDWSITQKETFDKSTAHIKSVMNDKKIPIIDIVSKFEISGSETAKKWMENYKTPNEKGKKYIAQWISDYIDSLNFFD